jgi:PAS domain S-box-containing protein
MSHHANILVIDDDLVILKTTRLVLEGAGYKVSTATTGAEGNRLAEEEQPDLILLDRILPDIDGVELCKTMKAAPATSGCFVVLASGVKISEDDRVAGLYAGADGYLTRPISNRELLAHVQAMLRIRQAEEKVSQERNRLASIVEYSDDVIISVDIEGRVVSWNRAAERIFGITSATAQQQPVTDLIPLQQPGVLHEALRTVAHDQVAIHLNTLPAFQKEREIHLVITLSPIKSRGKQLTGISLIGRDMSEQVRSTKIQSREREALEKYSGRQKSSITAETFGLSTLSKTKPQLFSQLVLEYQHALQQALQNRLYRIENPVSYHLRYIAEELGQAGGGPRDVTKIHLTALKNVSAEQPLPRIQAYADEGRLLIIELMGYLASYYRNYYMPPESKSS